MHLNNMSPLDTIFETNKLLGAQLTDSWNAVNSIPLPDNYTNFKRVIVCGMGGSALGGRIIHALAADQAESSIEVVTGYNIPSYADEHSLVIISSYSGNTEETVSCFRQGLAKSLKLFAISAGGEVENLASQNNVPHYKVIPENNPSAQPRMAVGYSVGAILSLLSRIGAVQISDSEINEASDFLLVKVKEFEGEDSGYNHAIALAQKIHDKLPVLVSSEHLVGAIHVMKNQLNESAKSFSVSFDIPELNHHLMEGLEHPKAVTKQMIFIFFESDFYHTRVKARYPLTHDIVREHGIETYIYRPGGATKLKQIFEIILLGSYVQAYLAQEYHENPLEIPWVDYFKEKLGK